MAKDVAVKTSNKELIFEPENLTKETIKNFLCPLATDQELLMGLQIAKTCNLNPLKREIYFIKYNSNTPMATVTGYDVYLRRAENSGQYNGMELTSEGSVKDGTLKGTVKIYRKDWTHPLVHEVYYSEYVQNKADGTPNKFWAGKPVTMIKKVAVSQGFRMAFPKETDGLPYTSEEMVDQEKIVDVQIEKEHEPAAKPAPVKVAPEAVAEAEVVKAKPAPASQVKPQEVKQPDQAPAVQAPSLKLQGTIEDKKIKSGVTNGKAWNKYGVKIDGKWMGTFDSKVYAEIEAWQKMTPPILLEVEYVEDVNKTDGKTYLNLVSIKPVTMESKEQDI